MERDIRNHKQTKTIKKTHTDTQKQTQTQTRGHPADKLYSLELSSTLPPCFRYNLAALMITRDSRIFQLITVSRGENYPLLYF